MLGHQWIFLYPTLSGKLGYFSLLAVEFLTKQHPLRIAVNKAKKTSSMDLILAVITQQFSVQKEINM